MYIYRGTLKKPLKFPWVIYVWQLLRLVVKMFCFDFCGTYINSYHLSWHKKIYISITYQYMEGLQWCWKYPNLTFLRVFEVSPLQRPCWWNFSDLRFNGLWNGNHRPTTIGHETGHGGAWDLWIAPKFHRKCPWKMMITGNTILSYWVSGTFFGGVSC